MRFNNRACALMEIPDLPQGAFEHIGDRKIKPQGGGGIGDVFSPITDPISDVLGTSGGGGGILGAAEDVVRGAGNALADVDKFVGREIPGGWVTVGAVAAPYLAPEIAALAGGAEGAAAFTGATETGLATLAGEGALADTIGATLLAGAPEAATLGAAELAAAEAFGQALPYTEAFDAVQLSKQGLTPSQIGTVLNTGGLDPAVGQYMGELAAQGLSPEAIAQEIANLQLADPSQYIAQDVMQQARSGASIYQGVPSGLTAGQAVQAARLGMGLLGGQQQPRPQPQMMIGGSQTNPYGGVDYSGLLNLLTPRMVSRNSLLG